MSIRVYTFLKWNSVSAAQVRWVSKIFALDVISFNDTHLIYVYSQGSSKVKLKMNDAVEALIESGIKPRKHPGIMKINVMRLPEWLIAAMNKSLDGNQSIVFESLTVSLETNALEKSTYLNLLLL